MLWLALLATTSFFGVSTMMSLPASAQSPASTSGLALPPLPLDSPAEHSAKSNPFCQPVLANDAKTRSAQPSLGTPRPIMNPRFTWQGSAIKLASGDNDQKPDTTTFRLVPLTQDLPTEVKPQPVVGAIKANPSVINEPVAAAIEKKAEAINVVAESVAPVQPLVTRVAANANAKAIEVQVDDAIEKVTRADSNGFISKTVTKVNVEEGPVSFSLTDDQLLDNSKSATTTSTTTTRSAESSAGSFSKLLRGDETSSSPQRNQAQSKKPLLNGVTVAEPTINEYAATIERGTKSGRTLLVPLPSDNSASEPMGSKANPDNDRIVKGVRPRVEVGVPQIAIARTKTAEDAMLAPASRFSPIVPVTSPDEMVSHPEAATTVLAMKRTEVRSLNLKAEIRKVQVGDGSVCSVVAASSKQLQLIGTRDGVTRLAVWSGDGETQIKNMYEIRVGQPKRNEPGQPEAIAATLTHSTKTAFPNSDLRVRYEKNQMIVEGTCDTDESAKQALRMIRSACLIPVIDKISIR